MLKICRTCGKEKHRSEFPTTGKHVKIDGSITKTVKPDCKDCHNVISKDRIEQMLSDLGVVWKCVRRGYDTCRSSLDFHHTDPNEKEFNISNFWTISKERLSKEVSKCIVLCRNCHCELHAEMWQLSDLGELV